MPCDVADPLLPAAAFAIVFSVSGLWARRHDRRTAGWVLLGLAVMLVVGVVILVDRAPGGCPA